MPAIILHVFHETYMDDVILKVFALKKIMCSYFIIVLCNLYMPMYVSACFSLDYGMGI